MRSVNKREGGGAFLERRVSSPVLGAHFEASVPRTAGAKVLPGERRHALEDSASDYHRNTSGSLFPFPWILSVAF